MTWWCNRITKSLYLRTIITLAIIASGVIVGLETYPHIMQAHGETLRFYERAIIFIFGMEMIVRILARARRPWLFFMAPWNMFDLIVVSACVLPIHAEYLIVARLFRLIRVLRLVSVLPRLQVLVGALLTAVPSIGYIALLLLLQFYIYSVMGVFLFGKNDPVHFGTIGFAMLSLFQIITLEGWTDILEIQFYGSDKVDYLNLTGLTTQPEAAPVLATIYFVSFILLGTMIVLNLFVGVIISAIEEQQERADISTIMKHKKKTGHLNLYDHVALVALQLEDLKEHMNIIKARVHQDRAPYQAIRIRKKTKS